MIIAVASYSGRVGSSLVMSLLKASGVDVGLIDKKPDAYNPNGYFENIEMLAYFRSLTDQLKTPNPFPEDGIKEVCLTRKDEFMGMLSKWFTGDVIALKAPFYYPAWLLDNPVVIGLRRARESQVESIERMAGDDNWTEMLDAWEAFNTIADDVTIRYEDWTEPYTNYMRIAEAIPLPKELSKEEVETIYKR